MVSQAMAQRIEHWKLAELTPYPRNPRRHSDAQIAAIAGSIAAFGFNSPILIDSRGNIIAGHGRYMAALKLGLETVPVVVLDHLSETEKRAYIVADNRLAELSSFDDDLLRAELAELRDTDIDLGGLGFSHDELRVLLAEAEVPDAEADVQEEEIPEAPAEPVARAGDIWLVGRHRLACGDCRDRDVVHRLFDGTRANLVITSPPYGTQREYDPQSGFTPVPPEEYVGWFRVVADNVAAVLAPDGSYFLNIKPHADDGERNLYVMDLVLAHRRQWGWRFVDEFCWRKTDNGVPGGWGNRFKNAWEPVYHFCRQPDIKFRPTAVGHVSEDCFDYSPNNPKSTSGSGLLGTGARGSAAGKPGTEDSAGRFTGIARPSNVIEVKSESSQGSHSAPFPRALVEFFVLAFTDSSDVVFDPFTGSGSSIAAAHVLGRVGYGCEISPAYCDVALRRMMALTQEAPVLQETGQTFAEVAESRGVPMDQAVNPKQQDARRIRHNGPAPFYGSRKKAS
jgi:DNA modification methylase